MINKFKVALTIILMVFFSGSSCNDSCPVNKVTLSNFLSKAANQAAGIDPLGGYIFFYWIDSQGNACHGEPGVSAQPGAFIVKAYSQEAFDAAQSNNFMSEERMRQLQQFIYANEKYHVKGSHFAQFDNIIWRNRSDGKVFMDRGSHFFSEPVVVEPENTVCLTPVFASSDESCGRYSGFFIPTILPGNQQHPSIGLSKSQPAGSIPAGELFKYCILKLPHGKEVTE